MKFKVAGCSKLNGRFKVRFSHDMTYVKALMKANNTDVELVELPTEMEKPEAVKFLLTTPLMENADYRIAIEDANEKYNSVKTVRVKKEKTVKAGKTPNLEDLKARASVVNS
jgi:hypothetical protein